MAMTRTRTYALTAIAAGLFVLLTWIFADGLFYGDWWNGDAVAESVIWTYVLLALIVAAGLYQAAKLPAEGIALRPAIDEETPGQLHDPVGWRLLLGNVYVALLWLPLRFFVGREWLAAGEHKVRDDAWMDGGAALQAYWQRAVTVPEGRPTAPAGTYDWYRDFLQYMLDHGWYDWFAKVIAVGEVLVGIGLVVGALVGIAAFFGTLMNFSFELAGSASTNPVLFGLGVFLVLGWKVAGWWGLDRWLLPALGAPWAPGKLVRRSKAQPPPVPIPVHTGPRS
jgi:thiosulfate dehydrogenase [quinone] large subunit